MIILGISALDTDSTATLFVDNKIVGAIAEERMSRKKLQNGFPRRALRRLFDDHGVRPTDIDVVAYPFFDWQQEGALISRHYAENMAQTATTDEPADRKLNHGGALLEVGRPSRARPPPLHQRAPREPHRARASRQARARGPPHGPRGFGLLLLGLRPRARGHARLVRRRPRGAGCHGVTHRHRGAQALQVPPLLGLFYAQVTAALASSPRATRARSSASRPSASPRSSSTRSSTASRSSPATTATRPAWT